MLAEIALKDILLMLSKRNQEKRIYQKGKQKGILQNVEVMEEIQQLDNKDYMDELNLYKDVLYKNSCNNFKIIMWKKIPYVVPIATQTLVALPKDTEGIEINNIYDMRPEVRMQNIHIGVFPMNDYSIVYAFYHRRDRLYRRLHHQMPPSVYLLGLDHAKVVLNVMAWLSGLMIAVTGYRHINWKELLKMSAVMLVGMFAGIQICRIVKSENILLTIYGIIIVVVALKNLCIHTEKKLPDLILWIVLILAGIIHGMFVSGGALLVIYATQVLKEKEEFRATVAPVWVVLNFFLMVTQFRSGLVGTADIRLICISILPLLIATWLGKKLVCKVSQKVFLNLTYILLLISGVSLIV